MSVGALLALASSAAYGLADFAGGLLSRRSHPGAVAMAGQLGGLLLALVAATATPATPATPGLTDLAWGAFSGVGTGIGMLFLYRGLSRGDMSVVVPVSAVVGVALPVIVGVAVLGDRPSPLAWAGILVAVPALWLVSRTGDGGEPDGISDALVASVGFAIQYLALAQATPAAGLWPIVAGRVAAAAVVAPAAWRKPFAGLGAAATGMLAALALVCYLLATRQQLVTVAVVLSSLYPVVPVLLGITVLRERLSKGQVIGLIAAALAIGVLVTG